VRAGEPVQAGSRRCPAGQEQAQDGAICSIYAIQEDDEEAASDCKRRSQNNPLELEQAVADGEDHLREPLIRWAGMAASREGQYIPHRHTLCIQNVVAQCQMSAQIAICIEHALPNGQATDKDRDEKQISETRQSTPQHAGIVHKKAAPPVPPCRIG